MENVRQDQNPGQRNIPPHRNGSGSTDRPAIAGRRALTPRARGKGAPAREARCWAPWVKSSGSQVPTVGSPPGFTRLPAVDPDHSVIHKGALADVVAHSDAQAFTGLEPTGVVARSDAQAFYSQQRQPKIRKVVAPILNFSARGTPWPHKSERFVDLGDTKPIQPNSAVCRPRLRDPNQHHVAEVLSSDGAALVSGGCRGVKGIRCEHPCAVRNV